MNQAVSQRARGHARVRLALRIKQFDRGVDAYLRKEAKKGGKRRPDSTKEAVLHLATVVEKMTVAMEGMLDTIRYLVSVAFYLLPSSAKPV